jgi:hypothetical protein
MRGEHHADRYLRREQGVSLETIKVATRPLIAGLLSSSGSLL